MIPFLTTKVSEWSKQIILGEGYVTKLIDNYYKVL